jgi:CBS domain containing-hemolysin-like protein
MREPLFIPETKGVGSLLRQFQDQHVQIAIVLDEYGGVSGVVTVEDIMEEIVGEIEDEYDEERHEERVQRRPDGTAEVDARVRIDEVNELLNLDLPEEADFDTVGGFVTARFARVPQAGEEVRWGGLRVRVLQSSARRVLRVQIEREDGRS